MATLTRTLLRVDGVVQGVGFRPYVYRLAGELGLVGFVRNDERGVVVEVEGDAASVAAFADRLPAEAPPLARVERVEAVDVDPSGDTEFTIAPSASRGRPDAPVAPDTATCDDCLRELFDPADRRYRYPFVNCTNCGPRFTIVRGVPYDRPLTTMAAFEMCAACRAEYEDPADRRYHAQPNACPDCGPALRIAGREGDPLRAAVTALLDGAIVAVKGVGGFHLACRADSEKAVAALRARKHREERPFALMVRDLDAARRLVELDGAAEELLVSAARPIVLAQRRVGARIAPSVAPRTPELGLMLPYSPLHHLLLSDVDGIPLVMTSGNVSDEPIAFRDDDAAERLAGIADVVVLHDRPIETRTDDSVVRGAQILRRSRGYVPGALPQPVEAAQTVLACGAELKSTFCLARGSRAWVSHHIGDLKNLETLESFQTGVEHFERLFDAWPEVVAHDLHPDYLSTAYALSRDGVEHVGVQHHHAHLAACLAEHGETGPAVGAIYDGSGYGLDGTVWGGELLVGDLAGFSRAGHLSPVRMPGGDAAVREPWRMAIAWGAAVPGIDAERARTVAHMARTGVGAPLTTSAGRLFDAVAALAGVRTHVSYEGQAAAELEALYDASTRGMYEIDVADGEPVVLYPAAAIRAAAAESEPRVVATRFHRGLADATARACAALARRNGVDVVVLSGGVFQNRRLLEDTVGLLRAAGLRVLTPTRLPANDGGLSYGQVAVASARMAGA